MTKVRTVALVAKPGSHEALALAREIRELLAARRVHVLLEAALAAALDEPAGAQPATREETRASDLCVVAGGDGTLIHAVRLLDGAEVPIFGINAGGQLGFLTEIPRARALPLLEQALEGGCPVERRIKLAVELTRAGRRLLSAEVFNDVVINRGALARMVELRTDIDGVRVTRFRADGVIVATPTGSTAYNLAANGPILLPTLDAIVVSAICPHTLTQRPLVLPDRSRVQFEVLAANGELLLSLDGQVGEALEVGDRVEVRRSEHGVLLVHNPELDFFQILRSKLGWGER